MKHIILGIKDYCKDCWHDYVLIKIWHRRDVKRYEDFGTYVTWKEGSVWHYIRQRKFANNKIQAK